jgi:hypothetical protein
MQVSPSYHPSPLTPRPSPTTTLNRGPRPQARSLQLVSEILGDAHEESRAALWRLAQLQRMPHRSPTPDEQPKTSSLRRAA